MTSQYEKAIAEVTETFNFYTSMLAERKLEVVRELEKLYSSKQVALSVFGQKIHESHDRIEQMVVFVEKLLQSASTKEVQMFQASIESKMSPLVSGLPQLDLASTVQLEFISNFQAIQVGVRNQFGYIKSGSSDNVTNAVAIKQPPIARPITVHPTSTAMTSVFSQLSNSVMSGLTATSPPKSAANVNCQLLPKDPAMTIATSLSSSLDFQNNYLNMAASFPPQQLDHNGSALSSSPLGFLEKLTSASAGLSSVSAATGGLSDFVSSLTNSISHPGLPAASLATPVPSAPIAYPPKAQIRRQKMIYHCKFGEFGILEGQFTEPSGVAVTEDNEIIVADTNNHRYYVKNCEAQARVRQGSARYGSQGERPQSLNPCLKLTLKLVATHPPPPPPPISLILLN